VLPSECQGLHWLYLQNSMSFRVAGRAGGDVAPTADNLMALQCGGVHHGGSPGMIGFDRVADDDSITIIHVYNDKDVSGRL
jgi:hypothetical protein